MLAVLATDGSDLSIKAARSVVAVFPTDLHLVLVTVIAPLIDPNEDATGFAGPTVSPHEAEHLHASDAVSAAAALALTASAIGPVPVEQHVLEGEPGPAICSFAEAAGADVIVVGSHGRGFVASAVLGSVSSYVISHAACPVLVVGPSTG